MGVYIYIFDVLDDNHKLTDNERDFGVGSKVVIALCKALDNNGDNVVYFDKYFSSLQLYE